MVNDIRDLYGTRKVQKPWSKPKMVMVTVIAFLIGFFAFPLGLAIGFHYYEERKKPAMAAFLGVFLVLGFIIYYTVVNWYDIMSALGRDF